jgi:hypothetical protein
MWDHIQEMGIHMTSRKRSAAPVAVNDGNTIESTQPYIEAEWSDDVKKWAREHDLTRAQAELLPEYIMGWAIEYDMNPDAAEGLKMYL